jgi:hypothetical protein
MRHAHVRRTPALALAVVIGAVVLAAPRAAAGEPTIRWERDAGIELEGVATTAGGGAVVTGRIMRPGEQHPALLVRRYDRNGDVVWSRTWHPQGTRVNGLDVALGPDGSVYVVGDIARANLEGGGFFLRKYGPSGRPLWKAISDGGYGRGVGTPEVATGVAVNGTNVVVVGHEYGCCGATADDGWLRLYRSDGTHRWTRNLEVPGVDRGTNDTPLGIAADATGMYVVGRVEMAPRVDDSQVVDMEAFVQKVRYDGTRHWSWLPQDTAIKDRDTATDVALRDGRLIVTGTMNGTRFYRGQGWLARLTTDGDLRWSRLWGETADGIRPAGVAISATGAIVVTGERRGDGRFDTELFLRTFAADGTARAKATLPGAENSGGNDVSIVAGGAYVAGYVEVGTDELAGRLFRWST